MFYSFLCCANSAFYLGFLYFFPRKNCFSFVVLNFFSLWFLMFLGVFFVVFLRPIVFPVVYC